MILSQLIGCAGTTTITIIQYNAIIIIHPYQIHFIFYMLAVLRAVIRRERQ